jgi:HlyD family secretion protein
VKRIALFLSGVTAALALFLYVRTDGPPAAPAARVTRATLVQVLTTNGKVEALGSTSVTVRAPAAVREVLVREGDRVRRGQVLASVDDTSAREGLERAKAQLAGARADQALVERGGPAAGLAEIDAAISKARLDRDSLRREVEVLRRLAGRQAATRAEVEAAEAKLTAAEAEIQGLEKRRQALMAPEDRDRVTARIREAEAALAQAETAHRQLEIRSPADGVLYALDLHPGGFYPAGHVAGRVGKLDPVRVRVLVDEPELGRVAPGQPVEIGWDAHPGRQWKGEVERLPSRIEPVGTRNVGEVLCTLANPDHRLLPNVTVNVTIQTGRSENALSIPREAVAREAKAAFVLIVEDGVVARRPVQLGVQDATRVEVREGLSEGQVVLLPGERTFQPGDRAEARVGG